MSTEKSYKDIIAFHPGSYVEDIIEDLNITQREFAERLGVTPKTITLLIQGKERISTNLADKLARLTGISMQTWINLQASYDAKCIEIDNLQKRDAEIAVCSQIDFLYFKKNGIVENRRYSMDDKLKTLREHMKLSDLTMLRSFNNSVSYRNTREFSEKSVINSNVMLELATDVSRNATENKYNSRKLEEAFPAIKNMSLETPDIFYPRLKEILLNCGIVLVGLPNMKGANLNGATRRFKNGSVMLLITDRNKNADIFWFTLIHELGHIYNNDFYSDYKDKEKYLEKERAADEFARTFYIDDNSYHEFTSRNEFNSESITAFAENLHISPDILIGRLQHDHKISYSDFNYMKRKYTFRLSYTSQQSD